MGLCLCRSDSAYDEVPMGYYYDARGRAIGAYQDTTIADLETLSMGSNQPIQTTRSAISMMSTTSNTSNKEETPTGIIQSPTSSQESSLDMAGVATPAKHFSPPSDLHGRWAPLVTYPIYRQARRQN